MIVLLLMTTLSVPVIANDNGDEDLKVPGGDKPGEEAVPVLLETDQIICVCNGAEIDVTPAGTYNSVVLRPNAVEWGDICSD